MPVCTNCGSQIRPTAKFCSICGIPAPAPQNRLLPSQTNTRTGSALARVLLVDPQRNQYPVVDQMTIGRDPANALVLSVADISRRHAQILWQIAQWVVIANGTFVNGQQVYGSAPLTHGDRLGLGATAELLFFDPAQATNTGTHSNQPPTQRVSLPVVAPPLVPGLPAAPPPQLQAWQRPPQAEGYVVSVQGPLAVEKDGRVGRAFLSVGLGLINPAFAFIPFAVGKNQIVITTLRVERYPADPAWPLVAVTIVGDPSSILERGDLIAVWAKEEEGTLFAFEIFNYTTRALTRFQGRK